MGLAENLHSRIMDEQVEDAAENLEKGRAALESAISFFDKAVGNMEQCTDKE